MCVSICWVAYLLISCVHQSYCLNALSPASSITDFGFSHDILANLNVTYVHPVSGEWVQEPPRRGKYTRGKITSTISGVLVHVVNQNGTGHTGCSPLPYGNVIPSEPWIALIKRGECYFDEKVENAFNMNASAAIVYNNKNNDNLDKMTLYSDISKYKIKLSNHCECIRSVLVSHLVF